MSAQGPPSMYRTTVDADRTAGEIVGRLAQHGARSIMIDYNAQRRPSAIAFRVDMPPHGLLSFRLPVDVAAMVRHLTVLRDEGKLRGGSAQPDQAERTAWRLLQQWLVSQLSMVEAQQTTLAQTMLPFLLLTEDETVYDRFVSSGLRELAGPVHEGTVMES